MRTFLGVILILMLLLVGMSSLSCACSPSNQTGASQSGAAVEKGDPDWWKKQPDLKKEETAINETITSVRTAFTAKDTEKAVTLFAPDDREKFKAVFSKSPDIMPRIAKDMEKATLSFLSLDTQDTLDRVAEYTMKIDGNTFYIVFIKVDGKWLIKNL